MPLSPSGHPAAQITPIPVELKVLYGFQLPVKTEVLIMTQLLPGLPAAPMATPSSVWPQGICTDSFLYLDYDLATLRLL